MPRRWVLTLLEHVLARLRAEYAERRRSAVFAKLEPLLAWGGGAVGYAELATALGLTEAAVQPHCLRPSPPAATRCMSSTAERMASRSPRSTTPA